MQVGCIRHPIAKWLETYQVIGRENGYTDAKIAEYGLLLKTCELWINNHTQKENKPK